MGVRCELYYNIILTVWTLPTTLAVSHVLSSTGCCSVSHQKSVGHTQHPFPCPGQCGSSSHSTDVGLLELFLQLPQLTSLPVPARAMTRLLISIFSPPFMTTDYNAVTYRDSIDLHKRKVIISLSTSLNKSNKVHR